MAEMTKGTEAKKDEMQVEKEKLESVKRADAAVKTMHDFTSPEVLYKELINSVLKYHPSTDISMIEKAYKVVRRMRDRRGSPVNHISSILCVWQSFWQIWSWIKRQSWQVFFMTRSRIPG